MQKINDIVRSAEGFRYVNTKEVGITVRPAEVSKFVSTRKMRGTACHVVLLTVRLNCVSTVKMLDIVSPVALE